MRLPWVNSASGTWIDSVLFPVIVVLAVLFEAIWLRSMVAEDNVVFPDTLAAVGKSSVGVIEPPGKVMFMILPGWVNKKERDVAFVVAELNPF